MRFVLKTIFDGLEDVGVDCQDDDVIGHRDEPKVGVVDCLHWSIEQFYE